MLIHAREWCVYEVSGQAFAATQGIHDPLYSRAVFHEKTAMSLAHSIEVEVNAREGRVTVFDLQSEQVRHEFQTGDSAATTAIGLSPSAALIITAHRDEFRIWASADGTLLATLPGSVPQVRSLRWFPDGAAFLAWGRQGHLAEFPIPADLATRAVC